MIASHKPGLLPASSAKKPAPTAARAATAMTALGPSKYWSNTTSETQPIAAPMRSAAYSRLTRSGKRVRASATTIPLKTNGTEMITQVARTDQSPARFPCGENGRESWVMKHGGIVTAKRSEYFHSLVRSASSGKRCGQ